MEQINTCILLLFLLGMLLVSYLKNSNPEIKLFQLKKGKVKPFKLQMKTDFLVWNTISKTGISANNTGVNFRNFQF